jgi:hypothetical protein
MARSCAARFDSGSSGELLVPPSAAGVLVLAGNSVLRVGRGAGAMLGAGAEAGRTERLREERGVGAMAGSFMAALPSPTLSRGAGEELCAGVGRAEGIGSPQSGGS